MAVVTIAIPQNSEIISNTISGGCFTYSPCPVEFCDFHSCYLEKQSKLAVTTQRNFLVMSEVIIHIRSLVCAGINKRTDIGGDSKSNMCTLARSLLTPTEAITFLTDYNIPDVLIPELISRPTPKLTPGSPPEIQPIWRTMNKTLPLEAKLDPEAISVPAPNLAPGSPPGIQPNWRPSPDGRTLKVQASVDKIGLVVFDVLQHADELAQSISPDDTCFSFSARYSVEAQSIDSFSGGAIDKEYLGNKENIISEQTGNLFALNLRVITGDDPPDLRSLPVDAPLEKISTKALVKETLKKSFAAVAAASTAPAPCTTCKQTAHRSGDTQKYHFRRAGWRDNPRDDFCNISICQASLKRCIYKDVADILARKYLLLRRKERTLLPM